MKKVLIISYYFQQKEAIGAIRLRGLAKYLLSFGWEITILSGTGGNDQNFEVSELVIDDVLTKWKKVLNLNYDKTLKEQLGIAVHKKKPSFIDYILKIWEELFAYPDANRTWIQPAVARGKELLCKQKYDAIISSSGPSSVHVVAASLASEFKLPWIADFRDLWTQNHYYHHSRIRKYFEKKFEYSTLFTANGLTTVSLPLAEKLQILHKDKRVFVIPNGFDPIQIHPGYTVTKQFCIVYTGFLYKGLQDPEPLFQAVKVLINEREIEPELIEVNFFGYDEGWLITDVKKYQLENVVKIHGMISREESIQKQRESQILLLLTWNDPAEKGVYTGKLFDYLAARRPILSLGYTEGGVVKELLDQTQAGVHCSNEAELREYLLKAYQEYKELGAVQYRGIEAEVMKYSHREMARKFAEVLDEITVH